MSSKIKILPRTLVEKIAAGEVVERPASVVKELVENSIDARATKISVYIKKGGLEEIRVVDNGIGMTEEEAKLAFERHATSKIQDEKDLCNIRTLGFRGEALPSIAAVSKVELLTRPYESPVGTHIIINGGTVLKVEPAGCPPGTSIAVRSLFYNTPARLKFLKGERYEFGQIMGIMEKYALLYENIHFSLYHNGRKVFDVPPGPLINRISTLWGKDVARSMVEIKREGKVSFRGFFSKPYMTRKDKNRIVTFVNGRYVKNYTLTHYIIEGYRTLLFRDVYPYAVLILNVPPEEIDVNVHPSKFVIKFRDEESIKKVIEDAIWEELTASDNIPVEKDTDAKKVSEPVYGEVKKERQMVFNVEDKGKKKSLFDYLSRARVPGIEVLGQFDDTYIIAKSSDSLIIVDQHAAHERIRYEKFLAEMREHKIQELIEPVVINLGVRDYQELIAMKDKLRDFCLLIDDFGDGAIIVRGIPPILKRDDVVEVIRGIIAIGKEYIEKKRDEIIKLISCKGAIKAHDKLSIYEMEDLIGQLLKCENPYTCPHGRPTMIKFTPNDLEKMFKRKE